jgi:hypothetical protein
MYFISTSKVGLFILPKFLQVIFIILILSSTINSIMTNDLRILTTYFSFIFIFLTISKFSSEMKNNVPRAIGSVPIFKSIIWINLFFILLCLAVDGLYTYRYQGIFDKSNSTGRFAGCSFIFSTICILFLDKEKLLKIISTIVLVASLIFLVVSNSRAPLLATIVSFFILIGTYSIIKKKKFIVFIIFGTTILLGEMILNYFFADIIEIFKFKFNRGDGTSGRIQLWNYGLNYFNFFGSSEYNDLPLKKDVHNNYLSQTLKYGIINSICFHIIPFYFLFNSFKKIIFLRKLDPNLGVILGMSSFIIIYYIFETASLIAPFWLMLIFTALSYEKIWSNKKTF